MVATIAFMIGVVAIFLLNLKNVKLNSQNQTKNQLNFRNFIDIRSLPIATIMLIAGFSYGGILAFLSLYTKELDLNFAGSIYYPFYSVVALCAVWMSGKIFDFKRENFITTLTLISFFISLILLSFAKNSIYILSSAFFLAFGWASFKSLAQTIAIKLTTNDKIGLANSTFFIAANLGIGISPYVLGFFEPKFGFSGVYTISAFVILAGAGFYYLLVWRFFR